MSIRNEKSRNYSDKKITEVDDRKSSNHQKYTSSKNLSTGSGYHKTTGNKSSSVHNLVSSSSRARMADENSPRKTGTRKASNVDNEFSNDEYDHCDEFAESKSAYLLRNRVNEEERKQLSPMKRNNQSLPVAESPKKRLRMPDFTSGAAADLPQMQTPKYKSKGSMSMCLINEHKNSISSTPKSERRVNAAGSSRLSSLNNSDAIERNMSNNWGDILEELEIQTKELNEYVDKVSSKYELDKEKLLKKLETDAETLRKRQKRINLGKITPEYQRFVMNVPRNKREQFHPRTPNKFRKCSRRKFDGQVKKWRKLLHVWDENPDNLKDFKYSMDIEDAESSAERNNLTEDDFGFTSKIEGSIASYNIDDYDIIDYDVAEEIN